MLLIKQICLLMLLFLLVSCNGSEAVTDNASPNAEVDTVVEADATPDADDATVAMIEIDFIESAPKDRFVITNVGGCSLEALTVEFDLSQSAGKLIFDTTATGAGVEVFQPFEVVSGEIEQISAEGVQDGDSTLALRITNLAANDSASFTIDLDDTLENSELGEIRVAGSEISGGLVQIMAGETIATGSFNDASTALVLLPACAVSS